MNDHLGEYLPLLQNKEVVVILTPPLRFGLSPE
jgi:hypothetical protein